MVYQWVKGSRINADAQTVGEELEQIPGKLKPESVVEVAKDESLELHKCFEWDDSEAAKKFRITQAREVLRFIAVVHMTEKDGGEPEKIVVRAYENVKPESEDRLYVDTFSALENPEYRQQVFNRLKATIDEARMTAETYSYLSNNLFEVRKHLAAASSEIEAIAQ